MSQRWGVGLAVLLLVVAAAVVVAMLARGPRGRTRAGRGGPGR